MLNVYPYIEHQRQQSLICVVVLALKCACLCRRKQFQGALKSDVSTPQISEG